MHSEMYTQGLKLSKNHKKRKKEDTEELYKIIKRAIIISQDKTKKECDKAMQFLIELYTPLISSISFSLFKRVTSTVEFDDVKQEVSMMFVFLTDRYNAEKSEFSYYIYKMLPRYMTKWIKKEMTYQTNMSPFTYNVDLIFDKNLGTSLIVEDYLESFIVHKEYIEFINEKSKQKSKSKTNKEVCLNYFLGADTILQIANRLGISYHAVYQKISSTKEELKDFFHTSVFCGYRITSTGIIPI